jgi:two-component sensor histidine kinase
MPERKVHILYIDDDATLVRLVERACVRRGYSLTSASTVEEGLEKLSSFDVSAIVLDHDLKGDTGMDFLRAIEGMHSRPPVIYVTGSTEAAVAVGALKAGAADYVTKSAAGDFLELLFSALDQSLERARLERAKIRAEQEVREARDRAEIMLHEVNHRVANSLALVASFVRLQSSLVTDPNAAAALTETQARIKAISGVHRRLYKSTDIRSVALDEYVRDLVEDLKTSILADGATARIELTAEPMAVGTDKAVSIGVALTELVTNAVKYAYPGRASGPVRVSLRSTSPGRAALSVEDEGIGWDGNGAAKGTGLGTRIVTAMMANLNAEMSYERVPVGTRGSFEFAI